MKIKQYGLLIFSIIIAIIGHFQVSTSVQPKGIEVYSNPSVLSSISNGVFLGGVLFFVGMGILFYSLYHIVKETA
ncbi:hypothetical protein AC622_11855 [Bacillus sp. FJAT-27916]|uniref:hypothetical protein n=1 Tax=Bacillaceae TaxID=186817 RepID=UPI000670867B|nr:hypothetical protein [Bacillus sp. FJAT-27916]KMY44828.1 hypothetical protein AC622_11855 [Bacillus sp. FJAT-27916]